MNNPKLVPLTILVPVEQSDVLQRLAAAYDISVDEVVGWMLDRGIPDFTALDRAERNLSPEEAQAMHEAEARAIQEIRARFATLKPAPKQEI